MTKAIDMRRKAVEDSSEEEDGVDEDDEEWEWASTGELCMLFVVKVAFGVVKRFEAKHIA